MRRGSTWRPDDERRTNSGRDTPPSSAATLDLQPPIFTKRDPRAIALSLQHSAERSRRRKADPYRSAMSLLTQNLPAAQLRVLERAQAEVRGRRGRA